MADEIQAARLDVEKAEAEQEMILDQIFTRPYQETANYAILAGTKAVEAERKTQGFITKLRTAQAKATRAAEIQVVAGAAAASPASASAALPGPVSATSPASASAAASHQPPPLLHLHQPSAAPHERRRNYESNSNKTCCRILLNEKRLNP